MKNENNINHYNIIHSLGIYDHAFEDDRVNEAINYAIQYYANINVSKPFNNELFSVAKIIINMKLDANSVIVALLYDFIVHSTSTPKEMREHFGNDAVELFDNLRQISQVAFPQNQLIASPEKCRKLFMSMVCDIRVLYVILIRRLETMRNIANIDSTERIHEIAIETIQMYAPIAARVGLEEIASELYDCCFQILHPAARKFILNKLDLMLPCRDGYINQMKHEIQNICTNNNFAIKVFGRIKASYSIWLKMDRQRSGIEELSDVIGFRIIANNKLECYEILNLIKTQYQSIPKTYHDFIKKPKSNNYQSIHIVMIGKFQEKIEIQIRTQEMHETAELGSAVHWRYKQNSYNEEFIKYKAMQELFINLCKTSNLNNFLKHTKLQMYFDKVFCLSQGSGGIVSLSKGSTPIDLAFKLHSSIGYNCIAARVNGDVVPLEYVLTTGEHVEIVTEKNTNIKFEN